jgi:hypothetical protein
MPVASRYGEANKMKTGGQVFISNGADVLAFVLGCATEFSVHFVGELYLAEIMLMFLFPIFLVLRGKRLMRPELKTIYSLMGLWLLGLIVSDVYNHIDIVDRMRGSALIIFFAINIFSLSMLIGENEKRKVLFMVGLMVGSFAAVKLQPSPVFETYPWKFGYASATIQLAMLLSAYFYSRRRYFVSVLVILGICAVNLLMNYRSPVLGLLLTIVLVFPIIPERVVGMRIVPQSVIVRLGLLAVLAFVAAEAAGALVGFVTQAGYVNEEAQAKNESQAKMGFLGGRPEFAVGLRAALDSPIIGHGSWAKDYKYLEMLTDIEVDAGAVGYNRDFEVNANGLIPGHSQIITAWVWAGIGGLIFWSYMAWYVLKGIVRIAIFRPPMAPAYIAFLIGMWWDIFFSPFAANRRVIDAVAIMLVLDLMGKKLEFVRDPWQRLGAIAPTRPHRQGNGPAMPIRLR